MAGPSAGGGSAFRSSYLGSFRTEASVPHPCGKGSWLFDPLLFLQEKPTLAAQLLEAGGEAHLEAVAQELVGVVRATARFLSCVKTHIPGPPSGRPEVYAQVDWAWPKLRKQVAKVYEYRSQRLHGGVPSPPLCARCHSDMNRRWKNGPLHRISERQRRVVVRRSTDAPPHLRLHRQRLSPGLVAEGLARPGWDKCTGGSGDVLKRQMRRDPHRTPLRQRGQTPPPGRSRRTPREGDSEAADVEDGDAGGFRGV